MKSAVGWTVVWNQYLAGLLASLPIALMALAPQNNGWLLQASPLIVLAAAMVGAFVQRRLSSPIRRSVTAQTGWCIIQAMTWSAILAIVCFAAFLSKLMPVASGRLLFVDLLWVNLFAGLGLGFVSAGLQFGMWRSQLGRCDRWLGWVAGSWLITALLLTGVLTVIDQSRGGIAGWFWTVMIGFPPIWMFQAAIVDFALPAARPHLPAPGK